MFLSVDGGCSWIYSSGTSQGAAVDVCYFDGGRSQNSVSIPRGPEGPPSMFVMLMVDAPRSPSALAWGPAVGVS
jgi:hypothetical protein